MDRAPSRVWDLLEHYAESAPNDSLYTFLDASGVGKTVTVSQFRQDAIATANYLKAHGAQPDELLLVSINQGYESATIFWGAMLLGAIPSVLAYSPPSSASHGYVRSIENLIEFTGAPALVVEPDYLDGFTQDDGFSLIAKPTTDELGKHVDASPFLGQSKGGTAYVQFSSGTTGTPKGVVLTHEAIIDYLAAMHTAWEIQESDVFVGWLPLFHDMGLTIQLLQPVF
ncbi:MAG: AMP-binding protein, partial [Anaerolineae bacterium]|nr:AMP-binding protein [Anaerolineae bacterium]